MWAGRSGSWRGVIHLKGLVRVSWMEATVRRLQGRQGFLALPGGVVLVATGSGRQEWRGCDRGSGGKGI